MKTLTFLGAGNIARAIIGGLLEDGFDAGRIWATDLNPEPLSVLAEQGINTGSDNQLAVDKADIVILSVKPDIVKPLCQDLTAGDKLFISVAAGITSASLSQWLGTANIIRCMPNTPALLQSGMTGLYATAAVNKQDQEIATKILSAVGQTRWFEDETLLDAVTAVSGSGPAYFFYLIELLQKAAEAQGLSTEASKQLVIQTALGAAKMVAQSNDSAGQLRSNVTSPGGTTEAALKVMQQSGFEAIIFQAVDAARSRSEQLSDVPNG